MHLGAGRQVVGEVDERKIGHDYGGVVRTILSLESVAGSRRAHLLGGMGKQDGENRKRQPKVQAGRLEQARGGQATERGMAEGTRQRTGGRRQVAGCRMQVVRAGGKQCVHHEQNARGV